MATTATRPRALELYRALLRCGRSFNDYNVREYVKRRATESFRANAALADVAELVETLVALCPKLTPLLNVVGQPTYGELRMQSIAFVYNALKSVNNNSNKTTTTPSPASTKPNELNNNNNKSVTTVRAVAEREINDGSMTRNVPVKDNLTAAFALRSGSFSSSFEKQQLQNQQQNDDDFAVLALIRAASAAGW